MPNSTINKASRNGSKRFTIGRKIGLGFGVLIFLTILAFLLTYVTIRKSNKINEEITNVITPSVGALEELNSMVIRSKMLAFNWVYVQSDNPDKSNLRYLLNQHYPELKGRIQALARHWNEKEQEDIRTIFSLTESMFSDLRDVMFQLNSFESYEDPTVIFMVRPMVEDGDIHDKTVMVLSKLSELIRDHHNRQKSVSDDMNQSFNNLVMVVVVLGIFLIIGGIIIAILTVRSIVRPVSSLRKILLLMGKGIVPSEKIKYRNDEIGDMSLALSDLIESVERTTVFANELGAGNFEIDYKPLSKDDTLGHALLKMKDDLRENERLLEQKVEERTAEVVSQKEEINNQRIKLEYLYKQVTDSIKYAKRIQEAILPPDSLVKKLLPDSFILYKPKDIVSGDFFWMEEKDGKILIAAVDCTGHGVPGAFMSIVGYNLLKHIVYRLNKLNPANILDLLSSGVRETLHQGMEESSTKDGMDVAMCAFDPNSKSVEFAGAYNPFYLIRDGNLTEIKGDKMPVGMYYGDVPKKYTNHTINVRKGDTIYIFSDGYCDQFGGPRGKKFMARQFRQILLEIQSLSMEQQKFHLDKKIEEWRGSHEQVDDILVIGIRI